jgi:septal ring factor EnvC (AmiA/AmiB activator)
VYKASYISAILKEDNQMIGKSIPRYGLLFILLVFFGCASTKADTRVQTDVKQLQEAQASMNEKMTSLQQEHQDLQKRVVGMQSELHALAEELSDLKGYTKISKANPAPREASSTPLLEKELPPPGGSAGKQSTKGSVPAEKAKTAPATGIEKQKPDQISQKSLRIKVLSGDRKSVV